MRSILLITLQLLFVFSANVPYFSTSSLHSFQGCETHIPDRPNIPKMYTEIRSNLINKFKTEVTTWQSSVLLVKGGQVTLRYDTDVELPFRQESNFLYLTGATEPDLMLVLDVATGDSFMFIPKQDEFYAMWNGFILTPEDVATRFGIDHVYYHEDLDAVLNTLTNANNGTIYVLKDTTFDNMNQYNVNNTALYNILMTVRVVKTKDELQMLRVAASVSSDAHIKLMKDCVPELYEYNLESFFTYYCQSCSLRFQAYLPIVGGGNRSAILHYNANNRQLLHKDLVLVDAAAEYNGYAADITRTYPVNGKFSHEQKLIYEMVLRITLEMESLVKPGVTWTYLNTLTKQRVCEELYKAGFIVGDLNEAIQAQVCGLFLPHGLGHFLGLDVHDASLVPAIPANSVLTIEPGIYFNRVFMEMGFNNEKQNKYLNKELINSYLDADFGGIRIEDDLIVNENGFEIISLVPKTIKDIEHLMNNQ